jgi:hypothetical protein
LNRRWKASKFGLRILRENDPKSHAVIE